MKLGVWVVSDFMHNLQQNPSLYYSRNIDYQAIQEEVTNIPLVQRMCSWESDAFEGRPGNADSAVEAAGAGTDGEGGQHLR